MAVTIIIPIFNAERFLARCIESCLQQTLKDIKIILINDGSTDSSLDICKHYASEHSQIRLIDKRNSGVADTRNHGIKSADSEYIMFCDADDYLNPNVCERLYFEAQKGYDLVTCGFSTVSETGKQENWGVEHRLIYTKDEIPLAVAELKRVNGLFVCWNKIFRKDKILEMFPEGSSFAEDSIFVMRYLKQCDNIALLPDIGYYYWTQTENSAMKRYHKGMAQMLTQEYDEIILLLGKNSTFANEHLIENVCYFLFPALYNNNEMQPSERVGAIAYISRFLKQNNIKRMTKPMRRKYRCVMMIVCSALNPNIKSILLSVLY